MFCPSCHSNDTVVRDSRNHESGGVRRRRSCNGCGERFSTIEMYAETCKVRGKNRIKPVIGGSIHQDSAAYRRIKSALRSSGFDLFYKGEEI